MYAKGGNLLHTYTYTCIYTAGDASGVSSLDEKVINDRIQLFVNMEHPDMVPDWRALNSGQKTKYNTFWDEVQKFLREDVGLTTEE